MATQSGRTYNDAIDALNSLQTPYQIIEARRKAGIRPDATSIAEMRIYLRRIGYTPSDLDRLNIVHVAGTKGKGSTCAFAASILYQYQKTHGVPRRIGLFTSPHLIAVRERIRIDGVPISEDVFARYFFEVWDKLGEAEAAEGRAEVVDPRLGLPLSTRPIYSRYLTLMSYHVFLREGIDVAVYETGIGGEFDATNIVERPVASGISTLGIDHVYALGSTVDRIAWHKGGIMKAGSPAFTIEQVPEAAVVLRDRAREKGVMLTVLPVNPRLAGVGVRPDALFQKRNASLGIALAETALRRIDPGFAVPKDAAAPLSREFVDGIEKVVWRGRCEVFPEGPVVWHVDGAHTVDSLRMVTRWFAGECAQAAAAAPPGLQRQPRALIFNQQGREEAVGFLDVVASTLQAHLLAHHRSHDKYERVEGAGSTEKAAAAAAADTTPLFDRVFFCSNVTRAATGYKRDFVNRQHDPAAIRGLTMQRAFADRWTAIDPGAAVAVVPTIEEAIEHVRAFGREAASAGAGGEGRPGTVRALITGSLHLVGGALEILEGADAL
ncbi:FolC bifunctional protein [Durotheca rogersii]|uniref:FolC bifunctional protein n=1 Tax=Durotheca rogersii TaxID=419775 RepID=UPI0022210E82|nr:FolC bifunctional protein [Durotheca rogersii]KAI5862985.1 FolC bifunctional protein [Durotheca rogersii]